MVIHQTTNKGTFGVSLIASTVIHLAVFILLAWSGALFPASTTVKETYYVDVVNLPVASPRAGNPTQKGNGMEAPSPPLPQKRIIPPTQLKHEVHSKQQQVQKTVEKHMTLPAPRKAEIRSRQQPAQKPVEKSKALHALQKPEDHSRQQPSKKSVKEPKTTDESDAFAEKMAKLEGKAESQQEEAVLERLRRKVAATGSGRSGMPGGSGNEAGSRYEDYIKSRLEDALKKTSSYSTKKPVVVVHLTIGINGQISRQKIERSTGDHTFELAVLRAIEIAGETLTPPPNHRVFDDGFIFKPRAIANLRH
jgi:colicin import membrane protein